MVIALDSSNDNNLVCLDRTKQEMMRGVERPLQVVRRLLSADIHILFISSNFKAIQSSRLQANRNAEGMDCSFSSNGRSPVEDYTD